MIVGVCGQYLGTEYCHNYFKSWHPVTVARQEQYKNIIPITNRLDEIRTEYFCALYIYFILCKLCFVSNEHNKRIIPFNRQHFKDSIFIYIIDVILWLPSYNPFLLTQFISFFLRRRNITWLATVASHNKVWHTKMFKFFVILFYVTLSLIYTMTNYDN